MPRPSAVEPVSQGHRGGAGPPLVLLHGVSMSWRIWRPVIPMLERRHTVYAPTLSGHRGGPDIAPGPCGVGELADDLEHRLDAAGIATAHLAGNSLGGWVALELAQRGRADSVVALSPAGGWRNERDRARLTALLRLGRGAAGTAALRRVMATPAGRRVALRAAAQHGERIPADDAAGLVADMTACTALDGLLDTVRVDGPISRLDVDCPVRLAWPWADRTIPFRRYGAPLLRLLPGAELVRLRGVGHVPMYDDPGLIARTILGHTCAAGERRAVSRAP